MHKYEDGFKMMTKISDTDNNSFSSNTDSMEIITDMKSVASFATRFQYSNLLPQILQACRSTREMARSLEYTGRVKSNIIPCVF